MNGLMWVGPKRFIQFRPDIKADHDTKEQKAPEDVYNELPGCCKYLRE